MHSGKFHYTNKFITGFTGGKQEGRIRWNKPIFDRKEDILYVRGLLEWANEKEDIYFSISSNTSGIKYENNTTNCLLRIPWENVSDQELYVFVVIGTSKDEVINSITLLKGKPMLPLNTQIKRYKTLSEKIPKVKVKGHSSVSDFFRMAPLFLESMVIVNTEKYLCRRGAVHKYGFWWGWDSQYPILGMGSLYDVKSAIKVFRYTLGPAFRHNAPEKSAWLLSLLGIFEVTSTSHTRKVIDSFYEDIKKIVEIIASSCDERGMFYTGGGTGADDPEQVGIKGGWASRVVTPDVQGLWYSVCRITENIAYLMKDDKFASELEKIAKQLENNYLKTFYDEETGYLCVSVDKNGHRNRIFQNVVTMAMDGLYGPNLLMNKLDKIAEFIENQLAHPILRAAVPFWNQSVEMFHSSIMMQHAAHESRTLRFAGREDELMRYFSKSMQMFKDRSVAIETVNLTELPHHQVGQDRDWQAFGARAVYASILQSILGLEIDIGGITYIPCNTPLEATIEKLRIGDSIWNIKFIGGGNFVEYIKVDGKLVKGTFKVPSHFFSENGLHKLTIKRGNKHPDVITLYRAPWLEVEPISIKKDKAVFELAGYARTPLWILSSGPVKVLMDGSELESNWYPDKKLTEVEVLVKGKSKINVRL